MAASWWYHTEPRGYFQIQVYVSAFRYLGQAANGRDVVASLPYFATAFAQESFRPTVRLKTGLPG